jgi:glycerol-3-phosphate acyltransferase PlsY
MAWIIIGIIVSYFLGSVPTAYIFGRLLKGIDIRRFGSGNVGATNAMRLLGKGPGIVVLALDILKGVLAVVFVGDFVASRTTLLSAQTLRIILGVACISGHNWSIFLRFKGGKGVATALGVLLGLALKIAGLWKIVGVVILIWLLVFLITRIVSAASVIAGISLPLCMVFFRQTQLLVLLSTILCAFLLFRHKANLKRILQGKEPRIF